MQRQLGATMLVAGTCIGGGMIALPIVLAKIGIIPSIFVMILMWLIVYYTSIVNLELHLQAGKGLSLGELGRKFSGKIAEAVGTISFKILSFALISVYIYGGSSVLKTMFESNLSFIATASIYSIVAIILLMLPIKLLDYLNRILFIGLIAVIAILIIGLVSSIKWQDLPLFSSQIDKIDAWEILIPVVFTSFGFQGSIPSLVNYCNNDKKMLKKVFFWGSFIPALVYIVWTCSVLGVIHSDNYEFYKQVTDGKVDVGEIVKQLSDIAKWHSVQILIWWISFFAIVTSLLGVSIALCDSIKNMMSPRIFSLTARNILAPIATILPAFLVAILIPNAFITVLGFAGMILVVIAILLPIYLLGKAKEPICKELRNSEITGLIVITGIVIIVCELLNML
jgi:tyrosine-specific transport protein